MSTSRDGVDRVSSYGGLVDLARGSERDRAIGLDEVEHREPRYPERAARWFPGRRPRRRGNERPWSAMFASGVGPGRSPTAVTSVTNPTPGMSRAISTSTTPPLIGGW